MTTLVAIVADLQVNSKVALRCPKITEDDGGESIASKPQRWLWYNWLDYCERIENTKADEKIAIINGESIDVDWKRRSKQFHFTNLADARKLAIATLEPLIERVDKAYFVRGTEAHIGGSGEQEEIIASNFDNHVPDPERGTASWWHLRAICEGVRFDIAHHVTGGRLPWTEKNAANKLAAITCFRYMEMGQPLPHIVIRSHIHHYSDSGNNYDTFAIITPSWQLDNAYSYRISSENDIAHIGGLFFLCEDGKYQYDKVRYKPSTRGLWKNQM